MKALVVGGTGPTGPVIVQGLLDRGFEVTIYHRGFHEVDDMPPVSHHLHGDPFDLAALQSDFDGLSYDLVVGMYGRLRHVAAAMVGKTAKLVGIGGAASYLRPQHTDDPLAARSLPTPTDFPTYTERALSPFGFAVAETERRVMAHHDRGDFDAVIVRYPSVYGPRTPRQWLWPIVRRALEGRPHIIVPGDGSNLMPTGYAENVAKIVLLACDLEEANGHTFNAVDDVTYSIRDFIAMAGRALGHEWEIVEISHRLAYELARGYCSGESRLLDNSNLKTVLQYKDVVPVEEGVRRTVRWLADNRHLVDQQIEELVGNPYAYDIEDRLVESFRLWQKQASDSIPRPELRQRTQEFRGPSRSVQGS